MDTNNTKIDHDREIARAGAQLSSLHSRNISANANDAGHNKNISSYAAHHDFGGMMPRRESIGVVNAIGDAFFGRRPSIGLGGDMLGVDMGAGLGGGNMKVRRGSMDSVVGSAIQNLANRRLSLLGGSTHAAMNASNTNSNLLTGGGMGMPPSMMEMQSQGINSQMGFDLNGNGTQAMSSMNQFLMNGLGLAKAMANSNNHSAFNTGGTASNDGTTVSNASADSDTRAIAINLRQKRLEDQQMELQRRQKELEFQREQLLTAIQHTMHAQGGNAGQQQQYVPFERRHSLFGGKVGALEGPEQEATASAEEHERSTFGFNRGAGREFLVSKFCNSKGYTNPEEAIACERACRTRLETQWLQNVSMRRDDRRDMLDRLGALAGATQEVAPNPTAMSKNGVNILAPSQNTVSDHSHHSSSGQLVNAHTAGNFTTMENPIPLGLPADKDWLTPLHCFVRLHCVEVFTAKAVDVAIPTKGKRKPIQIGQVGIRCPHCHNSETGSLSPRERGSVYYPTSVSSIYNATMNLLQRHLHNCSSVKPEIMKRYETLKSDDARSGTSKKYWAKSSLSLGLVDTPEGIRFSNAKPPPLPSLTSEQKASDNYSAVRGNDDSFFNSASNALPLVKGDEADEKFGASNLEIEESGRSGMTTEYSQNTKMKCSLPNLSDSTSEEKPIPGTMRSTDQRFANSAPLVIPEDEKVATQFSFFLLGQMQMCVFTEADRLGKRKGLPPGFPGLACRHCFGGYGSGRFFPSSIKTLSDTSKTLNVLFNHMMRCRKCPDDVRETLEKIRVVHDEQRAKMKFGSQKAFFARIWDRLHDNNPTVDARKRKFNHPAKSKPKPRAPIAPIVHNVSPAENLMNLQMGGVRLGQSHASYLDAANALTGGLSTSGLLNGYRVSNMLAGSNGFNPPTQYTANDSESNKRLKMQNFTHSNPHM